MERGVGRGLGAMGPWMFTRTRSFSAKSGFNMLREWQVEGVAGWSCSFQEARSTELPCVRLQTGQDGGHCLVGQSTAISSRHDRFGGS